MIRSRKEIPYDNKIRSMNLIPELNYRKGKISVGSCFQSEAANFESGKRSIKSSAPQNTFNTCTPDFSV